MSAGYEVHAEVSSANAAAGVAFVLYNPAGTVYALGASEFFVVTDFYFISAAGGDCAIGFDNAAGSAAAVAAGKRVARGTVAANGGLAMSYVGTPFFGPKGITPKMFAPAGQVDAVITGYVQRA